MIDPRSFQYVLAAAEHGSFRRAATSLNVQQSTISRAIGRLEARLGGQLFERSPAGIRPTPVGNRFVKEAGLGFAHLQRAMQAIRAEENGEHGRLVLGITMPFTLISDAMERYCSQYGGIDVELIETTSNESLVLIQQRKMDVVFVTRTPWIRAWRSLHLCDSRMFVALPKSHPLAKAPRLNLNELSSELFLLGVTGAGPDLADHIARRMTEWKPKVRLHQVGQCDLIKMVATGLGVTISIDPLPEFVREEVALVPLAGKHTIPIHAVWSENNANPALKALLKVLRRSAGPSLVS